MQNTVSMKDIGARLRAYRLGKGIAPETLASNLGISRAALYRAEKGEIRKIETLTSIADELGVSLPSLMGVGVEYVSTAVAFFERMRQLEDECQQMIGLFSPVSYLLTSDRYDGMLRQVLTESIPGGGSDADAQQAVDSLMEILRKRKKAFWLKRPLIVSLIASADLERFLLHGLVGRHDLSAEEIDEEAAQCATRDRAHPGRRQAAAHRHTDRGRSRADPCDEFPDIPAGRSLDPRHQPLPSWRAAEHPTGCRPHNFRSRSHGTA